MNIHVSRNGQQLGIFAEEEARAKLAAGEIAGHDLAWREGMAEWQPLAVVLQGGAVNPFQPPAAPVVAPTTASGLAIASLVCGIVGIITCGFTLGLAPLAAVITGHMALGSIKRSGGLKTGRGMAIAGLVMGYLFLALTGVAIAASIMVPTYNLITAQAHQMKAASNCRQIQGLLMAYAADHNGQYPDSMPVPGTNALPSTSNDVFKALFRDGLTTDEKIFGSPASRYNSDGLIGEAPGFEQALAPGENHWAMAAGRTSDSAPTGAWVFENPADASWPPKWNADAAGKPLRGRAWAGGKIVVGLTDGSIETMKLESARGMATVRQRADGTSPFDRADAGLKVLDIAVPPTN